MTRLTSKFWIAAYLNRLRLKEIPAFITSKGNETSGAIIVKINTLDGNAVSYSKTYNFHKDDWHWDITSSKL